MKTENRHIRSFIRNITSSNPPPVQTALQCNLLLYKSIMKFPTQNDSMCSTGGDKLVSAITNTSGLNSDHERCLAKQWGKVVSANAKTCLIVNDHERWRGVTAGLCWQIIHIQ